MRARSAVAAAIAMHSATTAAHSQLIDGGIIGAFPNNRIIWRDDAFWKVMDQRPDFESLAGEFRAEGHQHIFAKPTVSPIREAAE